MANTILKEVLQAAKDLFEVELLSEEDMKEFEELCKDDDETN